MKSVNASEARRRWFRLLDDVIAGEEVVIERKGHRIVIRKQEDVRGGRNIPDYSDLKACDVENADRWGWEWGPEKASSSSRRDELSPRHEPPHLGHQ